MVRRMIALIVGVVTEVVITGSGPAPSVSPYRYGVQCAGYLEPGIKHDSVPAPISYQVSDVGKFGVPHLNSNEMALLKKIQHYVHSKTLRFVFLSNKLDHHRLIVFDAVQGACIDNAPGYHVLNGACNEYYEPGENPRHTVGIPSCDVLPPPWPITKF